MSKVDYCNVALQVHRSMNSALAAGIQYKLRVLVYGCLNGTAPG